MDGDSNIFFLSGTRLDFSLVGHCRTAAVSDSRNSSLGLDKMLKIKNSCCKPDHELWVDDEFGRGCVTRGNRQPSMG